MKLRVSFIILAILGSIGAILTIAKHPSSPHTISYDDPWQIFTAIVTLLVSALPALILGFFNNLVCRIVSAIIQIFALMLWFILAVVTFLTGYIQPSLMSGLTVVLILVSTIITLSVGYKKTQSYT
ncbi:hypothetical protein [Staphylococcus capitis]|uniref:hypothetical protein n=1 Tax=Staphylococcus capitis TaxID=29388 RepID=UPI001D14F5AC|nr:hypothetical protein [Staphylococcus capitis]MCC3756376.1 hypothetical protein [Staphylococcus capitis]MDH8730452.1 hypothetical protein [Staphylococcus capitis]MDH8923086.1 hypothetical protein [Staphylococcus capitis]MDH8944040.1 hypothetical protein [Staphylococcus capitis]MDH9593108.1 hypothetical protein [Staphylococcus capitis]